MEKEALIRFIEEAFNGVEQPKQLTLHVAEARDDYDYDHDLEHRRKDYVGRWQDVPEEHLKECDCALSYLDKVGMRFYLPAYMTWYLKFFGNKKEVYLDSVLYALDNDPHTPGLAEYHKERFSLFNDLQRKACALFVKYCAEDTTGFTDSNFAKKKYERYWSKYDKND
jgi:hypothetical protein